MNRAALILFASTLLLGAPLAGCASTSATGAGHQHGEGDHHHHEDGEHHGPKLAGGMKDFHDVLAPPYHMDKGPARDEKACGALAPMKDAATKVAAEPKGDAAAWKAKSDALGQSLDGLTGACGAAGRADVSAKLEVVHDAFHALMKAGKLEPLTARRRRSNTGRGRSRP
jgi:hypothetical protein